MPVVCSASYQAWTRLKNALAARSVFAHQLDGLVVAGMGEQAPVRPRVVEAVQEKTGPVIADIHAEVLLGHPLDVVGLIDHDGLVLGQKADLLFLEGQVGEQERVIGDDQIGFGPAPPGPLIEAAAKLAALTAGAVAVLAADLVPGRRARQKRQIAARAILGRLGPLVDPVQLVGGGSEERLLTAEGEIEPAPAEVIAPAFGQDGGERLWQAAGQEGEVLIGKLLLQCDRDTC